MVVHNVDQFLNGKDINATYNGYGSCPLFTGGTKLMLAEFLYGGVPSETFYKNKEVPRTEFYYMKKEALPYAYWNYVPKGRWFGCRVFAPPSFEKS